jgi:K+-transporting ATPase ATPase A chain
VTAAGWIEIALYIAILTAITPLLGRYMAWVFSGPARRPEQDWKAYARSVLVFSAVFFGLLYLILRTQRIHPWNPKHLD